jgi:hypothetical protein
MFRANVYSLEPLSPEARSAVQDGIDMVATYMGETVASSDKLVRLPLNERGHVNPARVGFAKLDKLVELHLMAVPLDPGDSEQIGLAGVGRGWAFVNTTTDNEQIIRLTSAHEVAHAFGFVLAGSQQEDPESTYHCCDDSCAMHHKVVTEVTYAEQEMGRAQKLLSRFARKSVQVPEEVVSSKILKQFDFCLPCKVDMRSASEENIHKLRYGRIFEWRGI